MASTIPTGLSAGGRSLWDAITEANDLDAPQLVQLEEACRAKDRLDKMDRVLSGEAETWMRLLVDPMSKDGQIYELRITNTLTQANATANLMKQLLAALRLPDPQTGKKPQYRGPRGAVAPQQPGGKQVVTALDRARRRASAG